jgi:hypothetical protein
VASRIGPDGQRIVDQHDEVAEESEAIAREAEREMIIARQEGAREPSVRFWSSRRAQVGPILALLAGVLTLAMKTWPIAPPQSHGSLGFVWFFGVLLAGVMYIAGFLLADRHWRRARAVVLAGAALHLVIGLGAGALVEAQDVAPGLLATLFDIVPAVMAIVAALLISPPPGERPARQ